MNIDFKTAGLHQDLVKATQAVLAGKAPDDWAGIHARSFTYFHRLDVSQNMRFFKASAQDHVTNFPGSALPNDHVFVADSLRFTLLPGFDAAGSADADSQNYDADGEKSAILAAEMQLLLMHGQVEFRVGERELCSNYGLFNFPSGGGVAATAAGQNTNSTIQEWFANVNNGVAAHSNRQLFSPAQVVLPSKVWNLSVEYQTAIVPTESLTLLASVDGTLITRSGI